MDNRNLLAAIIFAIFTAMMLMWVVLIGQGHASAQETKDFAFNALDFAAPEEEEVVESEPEPISEPIYEQYPQVPYVYENVTPVGSKGQDFMCMGVIEGYDEHRYTWYSSNVAYHYRTSEWAPDEDGIYRDSDGYVVVASQDYPMETVIDSPFGEAKVYDWCGVSGTVDVYVNF